jgi:predicted anti-sigma-YlaC factor YlaD
VSHLGERLTGFVDGALDEREAASVQDHLRACEPCRDAVRRERHLKNRMTCSRLAPAPSAALVAALADRHGLAEHVARQERRARATVHALVTVGGLCASLTVLGLVAGSSSPVRQPAGGSASAAVPPVVTLAQATSGSVSRGVAIATRSGVPTLVPPPYVRPPAQSGTTPVTRVHRPLF